MCPQEGPTCVTTNHPLVSPNRGGQGHAHPWHRPFHQIRGTGSHAHIEATPTRALPPLWVSPPQGVGPNKPLPLPNHTHKSPTPSRSRAPMGWGQGAQAGPRPPQSHTHPGYTPNWPHPAQTTPKRGHALRATPSGDHTPRATPSADHMQTGHAHPRATPKPGHAHLGEKAQAGAGVTRRRHHHLRGLQPRPPVLVILAVTCPWGRGFVRPRPHALPAPPTAATPTQGQLG